MGNAVGSIASGLGQVIGNFLGHPLQFLSGQSCDSKCGPTWDVICYIENFCVARLLKLAMVAMLVYFVLLFFYLLFNLGICQCICRSFCRIIWACCSTYFSTLRFCCAYLCHKLKTVKRTRRRRRRRRDVEELASSTSEDDAYELRENSGLHHPKNHEHRRSQGSSSTSEDDAGELRENSGLHHPKNHEQGRSQGSRRRNYKNEHLRRSLRPNTHRSHVELGGSSSHLHRQQILQNIHDHSSPIHHHHLRVARSSKFAPKGSRRRRRRIHHRRR